LLTPRPTRKTTRCLPHGDVGCVAHILTTQSLPDGRSDILTTGEQRFVLLEWLPTTKPYAMARVEEFSDTQADVSEAEGLLRMSVATFCA